MCKATYKCDCGESKVVDFMAGNPPKNPKCDKCGLVMRRQFKSVNVGMAMPDEILYANNMMVHQAH